MVQAMFQFMQLLILLKILVLLKKVIGIQVIIVLMLVHQIVWEMIVSLMKLFNIIGMGDNILTIVV